MSFAYYILYFKRENPRKLNVKVKIAKPKFSVKGKLNIKIVIRN